MTVLIKGGEVEFIDTRGNTIVLPPGYGMCHYVGADDHGKTLGKCDLFFGPVHVSQESVEELPKEAAQYFGDDYEGRKAQIDVPHGKWKSVARVREIIYFRPGEFSDDWQHEFKPPVTLFKQGRWFKLNLGRGCKVTWRGLEKP